MPTAVSGPGTSKRGRAQSLMTVPFHSALIAVYSYPPIALSVSFCSLAFHTFFLVKLKFLESTYPDSFSVKCACVEWGKKYICVIISVISSWEKNIIWGRRLQVVL